MSWFPETMSGSGPVDLDDGVRLERRDVLKASVGALALLSLGWPQRALGQDPAPADDAELAWDAFVKDAVPMAEKLVAARKPNEEAYLHRLAALVHRLKLPAEGEALRAKQPLSVVQFNLKAGKGFHWHDHRDYNGLILCTAGEARVRSYDIVGDDPRPPKGKTFVIRETVDATLTPGRVSHLARLRDNVHDVRACDEGARLLDLFTFFDAGGRSAYMKVEEKPKDTVKRLYEAAWA